MSELNGCWEQIDWEEEKEKARRAREERNNLRLTTCDEKHAYKEIYNVRPCVEPAKPEPVRPFIEINCSIL